VVSTDGVLPACESYDCVTISRSIWPANRAMGVLAAAQLIAVALRRSLAAPPVPPSRFPTSYPNCTASARRVDTAVRRLSTRAYASSPSTSRLRGRRQAALRGGLVSERYAAVGEFIDAHPDAAIDLRAAHHPPRRAISRRIGWCRDRREVDRCAPSRWRLSTASTRFGGPTAPTHPRIDEVAATRRRPLRMGTYTTFCTCSIFVRGGTSSTDRAGAVGITVLARAFEDAVALDIAALTSGTKRPWTFGRWRCEAVELVVFAHTFGRTACFSADRSGRPLGR